MNTPQRKIFVQGSLLCIDEQNPNTGRSYYSRETLEQIQVRYPGAQLVNLDEWVAEKERVLCQDPPTEITLEQFDDALDVLPPQNWQRGNGCESFELCEHTSGRVTSIYCRIGTRYFSFQGITRSTLEANVQRCKTIIESNS